ncbi:PAS-domain containing protein [Pseudooceanicola algae]|uniref:PAS domain-containing protein n=1 Tax=Pseudooceanicola algae TaxID=1537215 RepID=A0A418SFL2_9RHOB|nr:PAS-domain containing protein [Pseudooceanicola algae]QPM91510.1 hypothetical protein PSAL_027630 [Pseudooceanicola algae]
MNVIGEELQLNFEVGAQLAGLNVAESIIAVVLSLGLSAVCVAMIMFGTRRGKTGLPETLEASRSTHAVFVFDEHRLLSGPQDWHDPLGNDGEDESDWERLHRQFAPRFPTMPDLPALSPGENFGIHLSCLSGDEAVLRIRQIGHRLRVTLREAEPPCMQDRNNARLNRIQLSNLRSVVEQISIPVWSMDFSGAITDRNAAFRQLEVQLTGSKDITAPLLRSADVAQEQPAFNYRVMLDPRGRSPERWFDVSARRQKAGWHCSAQDVTALVRAELAQRNFVQTLTKTFAQLSTGLAIFDRDRQLILFNPALIDLTQLSPELLTSRPSLSQFFDNLRDRQIMPEPKNYASWRDQLNALVSAAADGRYQETWSLSTGATYRVTGRPHPNGAVAFLFEDITDEILMTRRFRQQLSLSQSVLDAITDAIVIFDAQGMMSYCNTSYRHLFRIERDADLSEVAIRDAHRMWSRSATEARDLDPMLTQLLTRRDKCDADRHFTLVLRDTGEIPCRVLPLVSGACMVTFGNLQNTQAALPLLDLSELSEETAAE